MYKREVVAALKKLVGEWTTVRDEIRDMVIDLMENEDIECWIDDCGDYVSVGFENPDGNETEVCVRYELVGRSTWTVTKIF